VTRKTDRSVVDWGSAEKRIWKKRETDRVEKKRGAPLWVEGLVLRKPKVALGEGPSARGGKGWTDRKQLERDREQGQRPRKKNLASASEKGSTGVTQSKGEKSKIPIRRGKLMSRKKFMP